MATLRIGLASLVLSAIWLLAYAKGTLCSSHPLYTEGMQHQIIRSWSFATQDADGSQYWAESAYLPQYKQHSFHPQADPTSTKYAGLDYFTTHSGKLAKENFVTLNFQREAKVYLLIHAYESGFPPATLPGWTSEGWVAKKEGNDKDTIFGLGARKQEMYAPGYSYAFSKTGEDVVIPDRLFIAANIGGITAKGYFSALIGEADGSPARPPPTPAGMSITPGGRCPDALHNKWTAPGKDKADTETFGKMFQTWHPLWDPCFWCAYDHEHGSAAKEIMGYTPLYGYTALKNDNQNETAKGFKDMVLDTPDHYVYYGLHVHASQPGRFTTRFHTLVIAVTDKLTKTKQVELRFKADYGLRAVRLAAKGEHMPLTPEDQKLYNEQEDGYKPRKHRLLNVINPAAMDPRFEYRDPPDEMHGEYEQWATQPICTYTKRWDEPTVDLRDMALALKDITGTDTTVLGRKRDGVFYQQPSVNRQFRGKFTISDDFCVYKLEDISGKAAEGKFYTDQYGKKLVAGPGPNNIGQYINPGVTVTVDGEYETADSWLGLYKNGTKGHMRNVGLAVDETQN